MGWSRTPAIPMPEEATNGESVKDPGAAFASWFAASQEWAESMLASTFDAFDWGPAPLRDASRYALLGGGKRVRPILVRLLGEAGGAPADSIALSAFAIECIHTYSLVHDDLPAMDDDDLRRGRPTVHCAYDEATAILVGDALQSIAFEALARTGDQRRPGGVAARVSVLAQAAGPAGMVGGQVLDLASEGVESLDRGAVTEIHRLKTAALLGAAAELGALAAESGATSSDEGADEQSAARRKSARAFGIHLGLTFQAMDDVLDVTGDAASLGKTPGKDQAVGKGTLVAALGLQGARDVAAHHAQSAERLADELGLGPEGIGLVRALLARNS